jgi:integrase
MKLSDTACRTAKPSEKSKKLFDGHGLYLEITPTGSKLWRMKYRFMGKEKRLAFGVYPEVGLREARDKREAARKLLTEYKDPAFEKKQAKHRVLEDHQNTFEVLAREWFEFYKDSWKPDYAQEVIGRLERDVFRAIGDVPVKLLTSKMILDMAQEVKKRGANDLAKRLIQMCRHVLKYAMVTGRLNNNVAEPLRGMIKPKATKHHAALDYHDLPKFLDDLYSNKARLMPLTVLAVKFMMLTFVRTGEMIAAEWHEFDLEEKIWLIPASRMKMGKEHIVPLSDQAVEILKEIREMHGNKIYVFPGRESSRKHMSDGTILGALKRMGYAGKMTGHGFRAMAMEIIMEKLNYRHEVPDRQLAHSKRGDVNKAYDRAMFLDERKIMMQDWADYLDKMARA